MNDPRLQTLFDLCKTLLDEDRLKIAGALAQQPAAVRDLAAALGLKEAAVSRHLARLAEAGLARPAGDESGRYELDRGLLRRLSQEFFAGAPAAEPASPEEKVLAAYLKGERLTQLPTKQAKRLVVLAWLAERFEPGVEYPERTVNEILQRHHDDHATLRRALVDDGFMERQRGVYRRVVA